MLKVYYKPDCSTCMQALDLIKQETNEDIDLVEYLVDTPGVNDLRNIINMLGIKPEQLVRKKENLYKEKYEGKNFSDEEWLNILVENPVLIERPIVIAGNKAIIGRPPETVIDFLQQKKQNEY